MDEINIRSEEVQEILGTPPGWLIRFGTVLAIIFFILLLGLASIISYPDKQEADITIAFTDPPRNLVATQSGQIEEIMAYNSKAVVKGELLLVYKDDANYLHMTHLQDLLGAIPNDNDSMILNFNPPTDLELGDNQEYFLDFVEKKNNYFRQTTQFTSSGNVSSYRSQMQALRRSNGFLVERKKVIANQIDDAIKRKNILEKRIPELEASQEEVNRVTREIRNFRFELQQTEEKISQHNYEIEVLNNSIKTARQDDDETRLMASDDLKSSFVKLKLRVNQWINENVIYSPIDGVVEIDEAVSEQQFIQEDQPLMIVIPSESRLLSGKMKLAFQNSGLVELGQSVIIRLQRYPFEEFGAIKGRVVYKASVPDQDNNIQIEVGFPNNLTTTTGYKITAEEALYGKGQIITEEKVLLNRIFRYARSITASL